MKRLAPLIAVASLGYTVPASAQAMNHSMPGMNMPSMQMPAKPKPKAAKKAPATRKAPAKKPAPKARTASPAAAASRSTPATDPHAGHDMSSMPGMEMPNAQAPAATGHDMSPMPGMQMEGHDMSAMPGMQTQGHDMSAAPVAQQGEHAGHDMSMPGMDMSGPQAAGPKSGTDLPAGDAPPPPLPTDNAADRAFSPEAMMAARHILQHHHGGMTFSQVMFNLAEVQFRNGHDGYRWDGEAWFGGDINRLTLKSEGEGAFREGVESAEIQALYSRAIGPYFNLQAGIRHDFQPSPTRTYATVGFEGLAPGMFEVEGALFLSNKGDVLGRLEGYYDQRITQRFVLQPRVEANFAAQDVPENRIGSGLSNIELGLRLRYEVKREFAPYIGVSWDRRVGDTARFARAAGEDASNTSFVAGIRIWF
jgi:copper resistance protein B